MLDSEFYHQADKLHLEIDRGFLAEMIVKQMEHAYALGKASVTEDDFKSPAELDPRMK